MECGDGPATLMLHGMGGHLENFAYNVVPVAEAARSRVYAIDLLGHGMNSRPKRNYSFGGMIDHAVGFMDAVGAKKFNVVGLSLGGMIASWIAIKHPDRINKMILTTTFGLHLDGMKDEDVDSNFQRVKESNLRVMKTPTLDTVRDRLRPLAHNPAAVSEEMVATRHHIYTQPDAEAATKAFVENLHAERWDYVLTNERLKKVSAETLIVWGEHNNPPVAVAEQAAKVIPMARLHVCPDSGHWPHVEAKGEYNRVVAEFLAK
jgi:pimeloyl-ACP methyl ester carboxylesterase